MIIIVPIILAIVLTGALYLFDEKQKRDWHRKPPSEREDGRSD